jgi:hypothetical protein
MGRLGRLLAGHGAEGAGVDHGRELCRSASVSGRATFDTRRRQQRENGGPEARNTKAQGLCSGSPDGDRGRDYGGKRSVD